MSRGWKEVRSHPLCFQETTPFGSCFNSTPMKKSLIDRSPASPIPHSQFPIPDSRVNLVAHGLIYCQHNFMMGMVTFGVIGQFSP
ncbi:MAG TPA: hypothetical protein V6C95_04295 [Coleofasciculaceae cyanobacterium]